MEITLLCSAAHPRSSAIRMLAGLLLTAMGISIASAQNPTVPVFPAVDSRGVDVALGGFNYSQTDVAIGPQGNGGLTYTRYYMSTGWTTNQTGQLFINGTSYSVSLGTSKETFTATGSDCTAYISPDQQQGSTLTCTDSTHFVYTTADGTVADYLWEPGNAIGYVTSVTRPDGEVIQYHYDTGTLNCFPDPQNCASVTYAQRLNSVDNNLGYRLVLEYPGTVDQGVIPSRVTGINTAYEFCGGSDCTQSWPYVTYTYDANNSLKTATNALGQITNYSYYISSNQVPLLSTVQFPDQATHSINILYDGNNRVQSADLGYGKWNYSYTDASGSRTTTITNPDNTTRTYVSEIATGRISSVTDESNRTVSYQYDAAARQTRVTLPEGNYTEYTYDGRGNIIETRQVAKPSTGLADIVVSAAFDPSCSNPVTCNRPTSTTDASGYRTDYTYDPTHGGVLTITAPALLGGAPVGSGDRPQKRLAYAQFHAHYLAAAGTWVDGALVWRLTSVSTCDAGQAPACVGTSDETVTTLTYPTPGSANNVLPTSYTSAAGDGSVSASNAMTYTSWGDVLSVDGPLAGTTDTTRYYYDALRRRVGIVGPISDSGAYRATQIAYNAVGQVTDMEHGTVSSQADSAFSSFASLAKQDTVYDAYARPLYARVWNGGSVAALTQFSYDNLGRVRCTTVRMNPATFASPPSDACAQGPAGSDGPDRIDLKSYWPDGTLSSEQTGVGTSEAQTDASYTYTPNGLVASLTDARSNLTSYTYDGFDRLAYRYYPSPTTQNQSNSNDYDHLTYDAFGRLQSEYRRGESFGYQYDNAGHVSSRSAPEQTVSYTYDLLGRARTASQPGNALSTTYDALSRVTTQGSSVLGTVGYKYDAAGRRIRMTYPDGFYVTYTYNNPGDLNAELENGGTQIVGFTYDDLGRRATLTRGNGVTTSYSYDGASVLSTLTHALADPTYNDTISFSHNAASQIKTRASTSVAYDEPASTNGTISYAADGLNRYTSATGFAPTYGDSRGNLTGDGTRTYGYNSDNRLISATGGVTLSYDPAGRLSSVTSSAGTTQFLYDGNEVIAEFDGSATPQLLRRYVHGPGQNEPLVWYEGAGTTNRHWLLADERGSIMAMTDGTGAVTQVNKYSIDGVPDSNNSGRFQFTGQIWLPEAGVYDFKARDYHPGLGRFMQTDPSGVAGGLNLYAYAGDDPVNFSDPTGLGMQEVTVIGCDFGGGGSLLACFQGVGVDIQAFADYLFGLAVSPSSSQSSAQAATSGAAQAATRLQTTLQKFKNWLCNAGNSLVANSEKLGSAGLKIEAGGLALTGIGIVGQPEVNPAADVAVGIGVAAMLTGGAVGTLASVMQEGGGIAQMIGSSDTSVGARNTLGGSASLLAGAQAAWATGLSSELTQALVGTGVDTGVNMIPGMNSGQAHCGN